MARPSTPAVNSVNPMVITKVASVKDELHLEAAFELRIRADDAVGIKFEVYAPNETAPRHRFVLPHASFVDLLQMLGFGDRY